MELLYIYINQSQNNFLNEQEMHFSKEYEIAYNKQEKVLKITKNKQYYNIFKDNTLENVSAIVGQNGAGKTTDADHYYPQSKYSLLALSLYNIIPSCQICNRTFKGNDVDGNNNTLYPYEEKSIINELNFKIDITRNIKGELNCNTFYNTDESDLKIKLNHTTNAAENSILNMLYDFDEQDLGKKPLSKLKYDVYNFFEDEVSKKKEAEIY